MKCRRGPPTRPKTRPQGPPGPQDSKTPGTYGTPGLSNVFRLYTVYKPTDNPSSSDFEMAAGNPGDLTGDKVGGDVTSIKTVTDLLLGVVNWWCLKFDNTKVVNLVMRHFEQTEVYHSCLILADTCGLPKPVNHKKSIARPALDPCANDLVKIMRDLVDSKLEHVPNIVIPAGQLGRVPLDALSVSDERSVGSKLESLEVSVQSIVSAVEKLAAVKAPAPLPAVSITPVSATASPGSTGDPTFANVASRLLQAVQSEQHGQGGHSGQGSGQHGNGGGQRGAGGQIGQGGNRVRSRSPQVKRDRDGDAVATDEDGFRKPGRGRHQNRQAAAGASKVVVEEVGDLQPSLQYFIGNTPGKANEDVVKKVLERCAEPLLEDSRGPLVIESVNCLTKDTDPRTRCWRVVVPPRFKDIMENSMLYPEGWRFREFVGIFRNSAKSAKKPRPNENNIVDQVMAENSQSAMQGTEQQGVQQPGGGDGQPAQG